jgi:hypothetical protein
LSSYEEFGKISPQKQGNIQQISFCEQTSHRRKRLIGSALKQKKYLKMDLNV